MTGRDLKKKRKRLGISQQKLGEKVGISQSYISSMECTRRSLRHFHPNFHRDLERFFESGEKER